MLNLTFRKLTVTRKSAFLGTALLSLSLSGCSMADTTIPISPVNANVKVADESAVNTGANSKALDAEVTKFLRGKYKIKSVAYYTFGGGIPWAAISKSVQNQMLEKSINRVVFAWNEPGLDFVDVYPQGDDAFAVAMYTKSSRGDEKFVGYYVLISGK